MNCRNRIVDSNTHIGYSNSRHQFRADEVLTYEIDGVGVPILFPFFAENGSHFYAPIYFKQPVRSKNKWYELIRETIITPSFFNTKGYISEKQTKLYYNALRRKYRGITSKYLRYVQVKNAQIRGISNGRQTTKIRGKNYITANRAVYGKECRK